MVEVGEHHHLAHTQQQLEVVVQWQVVVQRERVGQALVETSISQVKQEGQELVMAQLQVG
jgi:predicted N-acetyltransferase YhbS